MYSTMLSLLSISAISMLLELAAPAVPDSRDGDQIRVACIGDSIRYGYSLASREMESYPAHFALLLGDRYAVLKPVVNGATLLKHGTRPYLSQEAYHAAQKFRMQIVIIQLGTSDTNRDTWPSHGREFNGDYLELIELFRGLAANVRTFVCQPPPIFLDRGKEYDTDAILPKEIPPQIREVARRSGATVIEVNRALADNSRLLADGVHLNANGAELLATTVHDAVQPEIATLTTGH